MKTIHFKTNINCGNCVAAVTPFLNQLDNIDNWKVDTTDPEKILEVTLDDDNEAAVIDAVQRAGYVIEKK